MDYHDYSGVTRKPPNKWTTAQYFTLVYLAQTYRNDWKDFARLFNRHFRNELPTSDGLSAQALATMWYGIQRRTCGKRAWEMLYTTSASFSYTSPRLVNQALLERTAIDLSIQLVKLEPPKPIKLHSTISRKRKVVQSDSNTSDKETSFSSLHSETDDLPSIPKRRRTELVPETPKHSITQVNKIGLLTPPSSQQSQLPKRKKLPRIAFRAFSEGSQGINSVDGFRAGAFIDSPTIPPPLSPDDLCYRDEALRHVAPVPSGPTRLISVTSNLVRALHRAVKLGLNSSIVVVDLHEADHEGRVQSATMLRLRVNHHYRPHGEYLIWGAIDPAAIISVVGLPELLTAMPAMPSDADPFRLEIMRANQFLMPVRRSFRDDPLPMSFYAGKAVGDLLNALSIPAEADLYEAAVYSFLADWKFEGCWSNWQANTSFCSGVKQAYRRKQSESEIPLTFGEVAERATEIVDKRATEEDYDRDTNEDQAAEDILGHTCGESMGSNSDELAECAIAIKEEHDSLDSNAHQNAWSDYVFDMGKDAAEEVEMEPDTRTNHISDGSPNLNDDGAFIAAFVSQLLDFVNIQGYEVATSMHEASNVPPKDHNDGVDDLDTKRSHRVSYAHAWTGI